MRLWSLHPKYLDRAGLAGCWREGLLARSVLTKLANGKTKVGYSNHSQLLRFKAQKDPVLYVNEYLHHIVDEAETRGYKYKRDKLSPRVGNLLIQTTTGQLLFEANHLIKKLETRDPKRISLFNISSIPTPHPIFDIIIGNVEEWEKCFQNK